MSDLGSWLAVGVYVVMGAALVGVVVSALRRWWASQPVVTAIEEPPPSCRRCRRWDLAEGQAVIRQNPAFARAAMDVPPSKMSRIVDHYENHPCAVCADAKNPASPMCSACRGTGVVSQPVYKPTGLPAKAQWAEFGACLAKSELTWADFSCDSFEQRPLGDLIQLRRPSGGEAA